MFIISKICIVSLFIVFFTLGCSAPNNTTKPISNEKQLIQGANDKSEIDACPQDDKLCDDGSTVSRTGNQCSFPACP